MPGKGEMARMAWRLIREWPEADAAAARYQAENEQNVRDSYYGLVERYGVDSPLIRQRAWGVDGPDGLWRTSVYLWMEGIGVSPPFISSTGTLLAWDEDRARARPWFLEGLLYTDNCDDVDDDYDHESGALLGLALLRGGLVFCYAEYDDEGIPFL